VTAGSPNFFPMDVVNRYDGLIPNQSPPLRQDAAGLLQAELAGLSLRILTLGGSRRETLLLGFVTLPGVPQILGKICKPVL
jgi:hypothetical protein